MDHEVPAEGWYIDPFGTHQHRWFSAGRPTALVRDDGIEASDDPPSPQPPHPPEEIPEGAGGPEDLLRVGDQRLTQEEDVESITDVANEGTLD